jgi:signal transduction histidine kinase/DNA-binding response OmpR family regulator
VTGQCNPASPEQISILVAEDSPTQAEHLRWILEQNGFCVAIARDGEEALEMARVDPPAIVVSDVVMPKLDGFDLCRAIKADSQLDSIGVILVTALASPHDIFNGLDAGADNFIVKPYQEEQLVSRIGDLLSSKAGAGAQHADSGIEVELAGKRHRINSGRQQILDLLISTYEQAVGLTEQLAVRREELARSNEALNALYDLAGGLNRCASEAEVASFAVEGARSIPGVRAAWLFLRGANDYWLAGQAGDVAIAADEHAPEKCSCQRLLESGGLTVAANIQRCDHVIQTEQNCGIVGHVSIPLTIDGVAAGILVSDQPEGTFEADQRRMLASVGNQISDALARARLQEALEGQVEERTRQLQAEVNTRREAEHEAGMSQERLLDAIDCIDDGFALFDSGGKLFIHNRRYRHMHASIGDDVVAGVSFETLVRSGLSSGDGPLVAPNESEVQAQLARHALADGVPEIKRRGDAWLMSSQHRTREGGVVVIETDITELKLADVAKDEFLSKVSHELRTPITPINGALALLASGKLASIPPNVGELVDLARRNCARLMCIVNDLLDFSRISAGRFSLDRRRIEIRPFLEQIVENKRIGPNPPDITLAFGANSADVELDVDPLRVQQILDNLVSNAIKFSDPGDQIEVAVECREDNLRISVVDHGPGIPKDFQDRVFEVFSQADSSSTRRQGGVGLGLSISKSIVEAHGGTIGFSSKEGEGAMFFFNLPMLADAKEPATKPSKKEPAARSKAAQCRRAS